MKGDANSRQVSDRTVDSGPRLFFLQTPLANTSLRSKYRTAIKNVEKAVAAGDKDKAKDLFAKAQAVVDTIADKGIFHKNKAARDKSRLSAKVKALALAA